MSYPGAPEPEQLARLVGRLRSPQVRLFIHLDRKADIGAFRQAVGEDASFLPKAKRVSVRWGGFSMIRATLNLIEAALAAEPDARRFVLLSGADYPMRPVDEIVAVLADDREHIRIDRVLDPKGEGHFDKCANRVFLGDNRWLNPRQGSWRLSQMARALEQRLRRPDPYPGPIYYGPQWWALSRAAVELVLAQRRRIGWFRLSRIPDEMVFATLLKASHRADAIVQDATVAKGVWHPYLGGITYVDFDNPNPEAPRTLDLADLADIQASGALFARKTDPVRSATLMDALDRLAAPRVQRRPATRRRAVA